MHTSATHTMPWFQSASFFLVRTPLLPAATFLQLTASQRAEEPLSGCTISEQALRERREQCQQKLLQRVQEPLIQQALAIASPSLLEGIVRLRPDDDSRRTRRVFSRLLRYLIRMSTRSTPFGMFSGVAMGQFSTRSSLQLESPVLKSLRTRPDMSWVLALIQYIEQEPAFLPDLHVMTNQNIVFNGTRAHLPYADIYGQADNSSIHVHVTQPMLYTLQLAQEPLPYHELVHQLQVHYPQAQPPLLAQFVKQLWDHHFLQSNLRPPLTDTSPTHYLLHHLPDTPALQAVKEQIAQVLHMIAAFDHAPDGERVSILRAVRQAQKQMPATQHDDNLQTDTALALASSNLPDEIGHAACRAAELLFRQSQSRGLQHLNEYRQAFLEKYGPHTEIPLLELLSEGKGLGAPPTYQYPPRSFALPSQAPAISSSRRDAALTRLVMQTVNEHAQEIVLSDELLQQLEMQSLKEAELPLSVEIYLQIQAASQEALQQGKWRAAISPNCGSPAGGRTFGRFCDMLGCDAQQHLQQFIKQEEALTPHIIFAELTYLPVRARAANVALRPRLRQYEIAVGVTPSVEPEHLIALDDLVVGIRDNRFYLRSLRLGKEVQVCEGHMLNAQNAPNVCRFLAEIGRDARPMLTPFDWGRLATAPFLPRVVSQQLILSPAQWNLTAATLAPATLESGDVEKYQAVQLWRQCWHVPRYVYWTQADNRLLLDLEHPCTIDELFIELNHMPSDTRLTVQEMLPGFEDLWLNDGNPASTYIAEIVVPIVRTQLSSAQLQPAPQQPVERSLRNAYPGNEWVYIKLFCESDAQNEVITQHIIPFIERLRPFHLFDRWFFIRYIERDTHIRLRLHAHNTQSATSLLLMTLQWANQLAHNEVIEHYDLDTYIREIERYGGPENIVALERFFTADSELTAALLQRLQTQTITLDPLEVAVLSLDFLFAAWGSTPEQKQCCISRFTDLARYKNDFRAKRRLLCELLEPWERTSDLQISEQRQHILNCLRPQQAAIQAIAAHIREQEAASTLWTSYDDLLASIAHMHINRLIGVQRQREQRIYGFWLLTLESLQSRKRAQQTILSQHQ
jgi:thiopeptide-type bacteriocin biosynthesis protein